ncbi:2-oxo acid dehydrogenase subunit E2 [Streptomyces neyagawaensis]|uniref:2-oxo acid dehydrogenase subunit E2 n=1 Tax=Streptomyces neyagawaensis TaxID=42238 RepID=UPI0007C6652A|nr:2-oxo acid dehydrogenase subunit E2 [Streptomyces neyagawaensis]MCL6732425.1 2-oxo acid dehydrogenase subunit E2 [Streptomyces neyagawaensis]MDE1685907.1 2-oxo acid dehydrogenase subunit E2 [Streptomyces neyagawaensis]
MNDVAVEVLLPKIGLTMQEGTIEEWLVPTGAAVAEGDALLRIATDKVDVDVEAEAGGLLHPVVPAGTTVPAGALIGWLLAEGEQPPNPAGTPTPAGSEAGAGTAGGPTSVWSTASGAATGSPAPKTGVPGAGASAGPTTPGAVTGFPAPKQAVAAAGAPARPTGTASRASAAPSLTGGGATTGPARRLLASPNARRVALGAGVDLTAVRGTGPGGRIVSEDVEEFLAELPGEAAPFGLPVTAVVSASPVLPVAPDQPVTAVSSVTAVSPLVRRLAKERGIDLSGVNGTGPGGRIRRSDLDAADPAREPAPRRRNADPRPGDVLPLTGMRGTIARRMHASLQEMAQLTHGYEVRMDAVVSLRDRLREEWADTDLPVPTLNDFLLKAAALALRAHPLLNATVRDDGIHLLDDVHLGFAVAVPGGLMVPVIEDAAALPLPEMARTAKALAEAAREGRITPDRLEGATFTVTSLGGYGVDFFTPVVNPGNVAILGVGRLRDGVEWLDDRPRRTRVLTLSLTFDHRAVDGAPAAEYLRTVGELLRKPLRLLV